MENHTEVMDKGISAIRRMLEEDIPIWSISYLLRRLSVLVVTVIAILKLYSFEIYVEIETLVQPLKEIGDDALEFCVMMFLLPVLISSVRKVMQNTRIGKFISECDIDFDNIAGKTLKDLYRLVFEMFLSAKVCSDLLLCLCDEWLFNLVNGIIYGFVFIRGLYDVYTSTYEKNERIMYQIERRKYGNEAGK